MSMIKMLPAASTFYYFSYGIMASLGGHKKQPQLKHLFERVALSLEFVLTPPRNQQNRGGFQNCSSMILKTFRWELGTAFNQRHSISDFCLSFRYNF